MTNLSSLSKLQICAFVTIGLVGLLMAQSLLVQDWMAVGILLPVIAAMIVLLGQIKHIRGRIAQINYVLGQAARGNLNVRLVGFKEKAELAELAAALNRSLDLTEAFTKEADAAMRAANVRKYYRRILPLGLRGNYAHYAKAINDSLGLMKQRDDEFATFANDKVKAVALTVASAAGQLSSNASAMSDHAQNTSTQSGAAATAADQASSNVQAVAAAVRIYRLH